MMSTTMKTLLLLFVTLVAAQEASTVTAAPPSDGLTQTDYIIIGVTSGVAAIVIFGGIAYACVHSRKAKKERDQMYHDYLNKTLDFPAQAHDNLGYATSTQQLAVNPQTSGFKAPVNNQLYYNNQPIPYPPGVSTGMHKVPSNGSMGYSAAPAAIYAQPREEVPAYIYSLTEYDKPAQAAAVPVAQHVGQVAPSQPNYSHMPAQAVQPTHINQPAVPTPAPAVQPNPVYQPAVPTPAPAVQPDSVYQPAIPTSTPAVQPNPVYQPAVPTPAPAIQPDPVYQPAIPTPAPAPAVQPNPVYQPAVPTPAPAVQADPVYQPAVPTPAPAVQADPVYQPAVPTPAPAVQPNPLYQPTPPTSHPNSTADSYDSQTTGQAEDIYATPRFSGAHFYTTSETSEVTEDGVTAL